MRKYNDVEKVTNVLVRLKSDMEVFLNAKDTDTRYWRDAYKYQIETLIAENHPITPLIQDMSNIKIYSNSITCGKLKPYAEKLLPLIEEELEELIKYQYKNIMVDYQYYKLKTFLYDEDLNIRYMIASFLSKQEHDAFLANIQKGLKNISIEGNHRRFNTLKNGYISKVARCNDENLGDGVHAIIFNEHDHILRIHQGDNAVDMVYKWIYKNTKTGLIPEWKEYFYNELKDMGLIQECEGFDLTGIAPKIVIMSEDIDTELLRTIKQNGLSNHHISLPVEENEHIDTNMSFLEMIEKYVLSNLKEEKAYYNIGEPISEIISSPIVQETGKKTTLYPRQQVIAQGLLNAIKAGKRSLFLNGGTGVGKTYTSIKLSAALIREHFKRNGDKARVVVYAQGHLIPKWIRQFNEGLKPIGIKPKFYEINTLKDLKKIPKKAEGFEVFLLPKDRVKRNYQVGFSTNHKHNKNALADIQIFKENCNVGEDETIIIRNAKNLNIKYMKLAALKIEKEFEKPVILYKEQLNSESIVENYKVVTSSKKLKKVYGSVNKTYDFMVTKLDDFINDVEKDIEVLLNETKYKNTRKPFVQNGCQCPECGGLIYENEDLLFDEEKWADSNLRVAPSNKSSKNGKCNHYIKADGTNLMPFEIQGIRNKIIEVVITEKTDNNPYQDIDGEPLTGADLIKVKAGKYREGYKIILRKCNTPLWGAIDQVGYRTVNLAERMLKIFGENSFDFNISDEVHLYQKMSEQGITFGYLCKLCKINLGMTGTLTSGKSSDLYNSFWRMFPEKMVQMGYRYSDESLFVDHYGRKKKTTKEYAASDSYNKSGKGKTVSSGWQEMPGISPMLYTNFLSGCMVSRKLEDMGIPMPKLRYFKHEIEMSDELMRNYDNLKDQIVRFMQEHQVNVGGSYLNALLSYPDMPNQEPIYWCDDILIANPRNMEIEDILLPKEEKLIDTIRRELKEGRKVLVYNSFSGKKGVSSRLMDILSKAGFNAVELTSKVPLQKREEWIDKQAKSGVEVLVTNPTCVETGLDIVQYPTIYFYELSYNVKTIRQAEKRAWRVGQPLECRIYYSFYKHTIQEDCVKLVGSKKKASLALEGVFSEDMLSSMGEGGDSGASVLYKVLQGKITLKEDELDAFGFETEPTETYEPITEESEETNTDYTMADKETANNKPKHQLSFFTVTEEDLNMLKNKRKKKLNNVEVGQISFLAM